MKDFREAFFTAIRTRLSTEVIVALVDDGDDLVCLICDKHNPDQSRMNMQIEPRDLLLPIPTLADAIVDFYQKHLSLIQSNPGNA